MNEDLISQFTQLLPTKFLRRSNENFVIICTPYLRAEFGRNGSIEIVFTGSDMLRLWEYEEKDWKELRRRVINSHQNYRVMANAIKERYVLMRSHFPKGFKSFAMHGCDRHRLTITIGDFDTKEAVAQLHVNDCGAEIFINMIGPHLDLHTGMRVAFNKSGKH